MVRRRMAKKVDKKFLVDPEIIKQVDECAKEVYDRSRNWLVRKYISDGLTRDAAKIKRTKKKA